MSPWHIEKKHDAENLTLLCGSCHDKLNRGLISDGQIAVANKSPASFKEESITEQLKFDDPNVLVDVGTICGFISAPHYRFYPIAIDEFAPVKLTLQEGRPVITAILDDSEDKQLRIIDNEIIVSRGHWDIEWRGRALTVRSDHRRLRAVLRFAPPDKIAVEHFDFHMNGLTLKVRRNRVECVESTTTLSEITGRGHVCGVLYGDEVGLSAAYVGFPKKARNWHTFSEEGSDGCDYINWNPVPLPFESPSRADMV